ncbi:MAG: DsbA family protein, partial [Candidatus Nitrosocosmicus sp.]|nr:DsbA family protein [Candidatus Nitrosocosmicus sp.]
MSFGSDETDNKNKKINKDSENNLDERTTISIKRSTFTKLMIIGVIGLMLASFFAGYSIKNIPFLMTSYPAPIVVQVPITPGSQQISNQEVGESTTSSKVSNMTLEDAIVKGKPNATVTLVDFSDFQCSFCERYANTTLPQIMKEYVDTGKVRYAFMHYPLDYNQNSIPAAMAAQCANDQGKFWEYHDYLFLKQSEWEFLSNNESTKMLKKYAVDLKIDPEKFNSCLDSKKYESKITKDKADYKEHYKVSGTPTFYIGNEINGYTKFEGAQPISTFKQIIDGLL